MQAETTAPVMRSPRSVDIDITNRCNLRCRYCYHFGSAGEVQGDLPASEWLTFFKELGRLGVMNLVLAGGEPFLRPDLELLIEGIRANRMRFSILSNGTLITDSMAAFLATTGRCDGVQVSIDGSRAETHDACRGEGNFQKAMEGIGTLQRHKLPVQVRLTIHRRNVNDLEAIARLLLDDLGLPGFSTNSAGEMGLCRRNSEDVSLTVADRTCAMAALVRLNALHRGKISAAAGPQAEARMWSEMLKARQEGREMAGRGYLSACGCTSSKIAVRADGVIVPCCMLSQIELGRINRDDLQKVWLEHPAMQRMRSRRTIPLTTYDFCRDCEFIALCTGNCPGLAYTLTGQVDHPSPDACLRRFLAAGGRVPS